MKQGVQNGGVYEPQIPGSLNLALASKSFQGICGPYGCILEATNLQPRMRVLSGLSQNPQAPAAVDPIIYSYERETIHFVMASLQIHRHSSMALAVLPSGRWQPARLELSDS